ncbi:MAG: membrane lipoprotein lipid attachment site-containing protein [Candidatus Omnitrophota bacterium]|nr:MAG: membrane lipoprotein lipid attachment site-containing protein [Candidatus Omnitrophota bacterium]
MKRLIFLLGIALLLNGCATIASIRHHYAKIDYSNGVNKEEAVLIAKHHLISTEYKYSYRVIAPWVESWEERNAWIVWFAPKKLRFIFPQDFLDLFIPKKYCVVIDKETGEVHQKESGLFRGRMYPVEEGSEKEQ